MKGLNISKFSSVQVHFQLSNFTKERKKKKGEKKCMNAQRYPSPLGFISSNGIQ